MTAKKLFIVAAAIVLLICSCGFAEVRKVNETVNNPGKKFILSGAFDVSYEFHLNERVGITELKVFAYDAALRQSSGAYFDAGHFIRARFGNADVRINIIRPEASEQYLLVRMFMNGTDIFENIDMKKYRRIEIIGGKKYYRINPPKRANKEAENFAVYFGRIGGVAVSRIKFSGTYGEEKASSMSAMFAEKDQTFRNAIIRKSVTAVIILALCALMLIIGRTNLLKQMSLRHFIGGLFATYAAAIYIISLVHRFMPGFYSMMMDIYLYLGNTLGVELLKNYKPYEIDWSLCLLIVALLIYFVATSRNELLSVMLLPVIILLQFFALMFTASSIQTVGFYIFLGVMLFLFIKYPGRGRISSETTPNRGLYMRENNTGSEPDFSGSYYDRDGHRYHYSYDTVYNGNRRIYIEDDDGVIIELLVDGNGNFFDEHNNIYYKAN